MVAHLARSGASQSCPAVKLCRNTLTNRFRLVALGEKNGRDSKLAWTSKRPGSERVVNLLRVKSSVRTWSD